jgi:hypothetical protein
MRWISFLRRRARSFAVAALPLGCMAAAHGADTYNPSNQQLSIPSVAIGSATYSNMVITVGNIVSRPVGTSAYGGEDSYDPVSNQLTVRSVTANGVAYFNAVVTVKNLVSIGGVIGADSYDAVHLHISTVQSVNTMYYNAAITVGSVVNVAGGMPKGAVDTYDGSRGQLTIPAVQYGSRVYTNVTITVSTIVSVSAFSSASQSGTVLYLQSHAGGHTARIGLDTNWGGAIVEVSLDGTNFVNAHDTGREVQPAVYDAAGAAGANGWDPVLGGDKYDRGSPILVQNLGAGLLYTSATPLQWNPDAFGGGLNAPVDSDMTFEQTVTLAPDAPLGFKLHLKLAHNGTDYHYVTQQEFPAVYVNSAYTTLAYYGGTAPWTNGASTMVPVGTTDFSVYAPELSAALVDANNQGLTVFVPGSYPSWITTYFPQSGGSGPMGDATVYMRPISVFNFGPGEFIEGDVYLIPGDATAARSIVYGLHQSVPTAYLAAAFGTIDAPAVNANISGTSYITSGWTIGGVPVTSVNVYVDGALKGSATLGTPRPDVVAAWPAIAQVNCGWDYSLDTTKLVNGAHTVDIHIVDSSGREELLPPVPVTVSN